jgi:hypothetical protein
MLRARGLRAREPEQLRVEALERRSRAEVEVAEVVEEDPLRPRTEQKT